MIPDESKLRLVMVSSCAWGAGKSTLSAAVAERLTAGGWTVQYRTEDDLLASDPFARFERCLGPTDPETHRADLALLDATRELLDDARAEGGVAPSALVTDALLPGFFWLFGRYDGGRVRDTAARLAEELADLRPLVVHLRGDPAALVERAVAERGAEWPEVVAGRVARWRVPHYPGTPVQDLEGAVRLWRWLDAETVRLLADWPVRSLVLDAFRPVLELRDAVLAAVLQPPP